MKSPLKISVVIPAYNCENYITRAIDSVLGQTYPPEEIFVVDDGSTDDTVGAVRPYGDAVTLIQQSNAGPGAARNTGIQAAAGDWVAFLDADDEWLSNKLQMQADALGRNKNLMWISGNHERCFCQKQYRVTQDDPVRIRRLLGGKEFFPDGLGAFVQKIQCHTSTMLIRRDVFFHVGMFRTDFRMAEDTDLWLRVACHYPEIGYIAEPLEIYHMDIEGSLATVPIGYPFLETFLDRHLKLAEEAGRADSFRPYAAMMLRSWVRSAFFDDRVYDIRKAIERFGFLLSKKRRFVLSLMTLSPLLTKCIFRSLSWLSRTFKLRRQTWHPKERYRKNGKQPSQNKMKASQ